MAFEASHQLETAVLLQCARQHLTPEALAHVAQMCTTDHFQWNALFSAANDHKIAPLVLWNLERSGVVASVPPRLRDLWVQQKLRNIAAKQRHVSNAREAVTFFAARGKPVMLVKGAALDIVLYKEPWYTQSDDVDMMVDLRWKPLSASEKDEIIDIWRRTSIEFGFGGHHDLDMNAVLDLDYARIWNDARRVTLAGMRVYVMSPEDMLIAACVNLCRKRYRLLKGMMAVREILLAYPAIEWGKVCEVARASGAHGIVCGALTITDETLGAPLPDGLPEMLGVSTSRRIAIACLASRMHAQLLQSAEVQGQLASRVTSELLLMATYRFSRLRREVNAQLGRASERRNPSFGQRLARARESRDLKHMDHREIGVPTVLLDE